MTRPGVVFTVLAGAGRGLEREYIRDRTLEGHESAPHPRQGPSAEAARQPIDAMLAVAPPPARPGN